MKRKMDMTWADGDFKGSVVSVQVRVRGLVLSLAGLLCKVKYAQLGSQPCLPFLI